MIKIPYSKPTRVDPEFAKEMREIAKIRLSKGLADFKSRDMGTAEMTKLLRRTQGYGFSLEELKSKPKKN